MRLSLDRDGCLDRRMRVIFQQGKVFELEVLDLFDRRIQPHPRQLPTFASQLFTGLLDVVRIEMKITESVDEIAGFQIADLRHHHCQQRVACDVEWNAEK